MAISGPSASTISCQGKEDELSGFFKSSNCPLPLEKIDFFALAVTMSNDPRLF